MIPKHYVDLANEIYTKASSIIATDVDDDSLVGIFKELINDILKESNHEQQIIIGLAHRAICAEILRRHEYEVVCQSVNQPVVFST